MDSQKIDSLKVVDSSDLEKRVKSMYKEVAENPHGDFHFEMGRDLALRLGYASHELDKVPSQAVDSFAGVGYHFGLAAIQEGERVLDLGSGSGMDAFIAADQTGANGVVTGVDMTKEQLDKSKTLAEADNLGQVTFVKSYIEDLVFDEGSFDVVISNGVINLSSEKDKVFEQIGKVLRPGGRMAISDIVTEKQMPESITCDATLWAACIGGASQVDDYQAAIERAGLKVIQVVENTEYGFVSKSAMGATRQYGVKSVSILARKL